MLRAKVHPTALVESECIGEGTQIWAFAHVLHGAQIGRNGNIGDHVYIEGGSVIGDGVTIKNGVMVWEGVTIGDGAFVGPGVVFTNDRQPRSARFQRLPGAATDRTWLVPTVVEDGASLGGGVVVVAGVRIGAYALVGAGSVVTRDVAPYSLVMGNPARPRGWVCRCGQRLAFEGGSAACAACGEQYRQTEVGIAPVR